MCSLKFDQYIYTKSETWYKCKTFLCKRNMLSWEYSCWIIDNPNHSCHVCKRFVLPRKSTSKTNNVILKNIEILINSIKKHNWWRWLILLLFNNQYFPPFLSLKSWHYAVTVYDLKIYGFGRLLFMWFVTQNSFQSLNNHVINIWKHILVRVMGQQVKTSVDYNLSI